MTNVHPFFSIIIPVYNAEEYLPLCIESVLKQDFYNFELILVNDGSKDSSGQICNKFKQFDRRIRVFHKSNRGVSSARNLAIEKARGEWLIFVDGDDLLQPDFLSSFADAMNGKTNILMVQNAFIIKGNKINYDPMFSWDSDVCLSINNNGNDWKLFQQLYTPWGKAFNRDVVESWNIRFDEAAKWGEDTIFVYQYSLHINDVMLLKKCGYIYRVYENRKFQNLSAKEIIHVRDLIFKYAIELTSRFKLKMKSCGNSELADFYYAAYSVRALYALCVHEALKDLKFRLYSIKLIVSDKTFRRISIINKAISLMPYFILFHIIRFYLKIRFGSRI